MLDLIGYLIFGILGASAVQDFKTGRVFTPLMIVPVVMLWWAYHSAYYSFFAPICIVLLVIWGGLQILRIRYNIVISFGLADVLAIPLSLSLTQGLLPFWGPVIYAGILALEVPFIHKRKFHRFLPLLIAPTATALVVSILV